MTSLLTIRIAWRALAKNKLRAGLTVLGVVIGIAAVTAMVSLGESANLLVKSQFELLGTNVILVIPGSAESGGVRDATVVTLTAADGHAITRECPAVLAATPLVGSSGQVIYGNSNWKPRELLGAGPEYLTVRNWQVEHGGFFTERDVSAAAKVCVLGRTVAARLFQTADPVGATVRIRSIPFRVVGVLDRKGANIAGADQDDVVVIPYTTMKKRIQGSSFDNVHVIMVSARTSSQMGDAENQIRHLLLERHRIQNGEKADFQIQNTTELANSLAVVTGTITLMLAAIAAISLLVGGVGIMNIMLVSVTERTREIGIRMAVGARGTDILRQFLVEAVLLSAMGGAVGVILGIGASAGITMLINSFTSDNRWPIVISVPAAVVALFFAAGVGVFFGYYPARRASRLDPIDALRYE